MRCRDRLDASGSVVSMFEKAMEASLNTQVFNLWTTAIVSALSAIWLVRNQGHFGSVFIPLARSLAFIWASTREANAIQKDFRWDHLWESTYIVNCSYAGGSSYVAYKSRWVKRLLYVSQRLSFSHLREGNTAMDASSKMRFLKVGGGGVFHSCTPMHRNVNGFANYRFRK
ncbi:hypothetical protein FNV43_RR21730 [Rhamnella rubrinervis]|uniref:Uncharacterized protein n=1 Tax=Rhamnella rubrinervis TaxID=2594499 RepID=A0A8K0DP51_9ROSA|nr:hypothetical protein FNV43_RR21730 [Rhamnella rubrinervis]